MSGLAIVDALSREWGSTPTSSGKTVWAVIGPENQL
ncbi:stas domain-containing protein [Mycobacterium tuberculosis]|nr:stas domain-containing protein [Mycobacterium tuberculosis]